MPPTITSGLKWLGSLIFKHRKTEVQLIVGTDSTWSLRVWICLKIAKVN